MITHWDIGMQMVRGALLVAFWVSLPVLAAASLAGLLMGFVQAATGQNDPSLPFAPRLLAAMAAFLFFGAWMIAFTADYWIALWQGAAQLVR